MRSRKKIPVYVLAAAFLSALLLSACGQTGALYMPKTHSTTPPPPRPSQTEKKTRGDLQEESAKGTEETDKGN